MVLLELLSSRPAVLVDEGAKQEGGGGGDGAAYRRTRAPSEPTKLVDAYNNELWLARHATSSYDGDYYFRDQD